MRILIITVCYALVTYLYLSLFQHPHSTVTLVISIQTNLVTYVKQLLSCKWLSHNHKAPLPVDTVHLSGANCIPLALCRYTFPSAFCFSLNTHLQSIAFFPAFESFLSNVTLHSSMWMPVARPILSILFTAFGSRCPNRLCHVCMQF